MNNTRYFSSLTPKQKDATHKRVCELLSINDANFISPSLWGVLFDVSFNEIMQTKAEADKYCKGKCFKYRDVWIPLTIKSLNR